MVYSEQEANEEVNKLNNSKSLEGNGSNRQNNANRQQDSISRHREKEAKQEDLILVAIENNESYKRLKQTLAKSTNNRIQVTAEKIAEIYLGMISPNTNTVGDKGAFFVDDGIISMAVAGMCYDLSVEENGLVLNPDGTEDKEGSIKQLAILSGRVPQSEADKFRAQLEERKNFFENKKNRDSSAGEMLKSMKNFSVKEARDYFKTDVGKENLKQAVGGEEAKKSVDEYREQSIIKKVADLKALQHMATIMITVTKNKIDSADRINIYEALIELEKLAPNSEIVQSFIGETGKFDEESFAKMGEVYDNHAKAYRLKEATKVLKKAADDKRLSVQANSPEELRTLLEAALTLYYEPNLDVKDKQRAIVAFLALDIAKKDENTDEWVLDEQKCEVLHKSTRATKAKDTKAGKLWNIQTILRSALDHATDEYLYHLQKLGVEITRGEFIEVGSESELQQVIERQGEMDESKTDKNISILNTFFSEVGMAGLSSLSPKQKQELLEATFNIYESKDEKYKNRALLAFTMMGMVVEGEKGEQVLDLEKYRKEMQDIENSQSKEMGTSSEDKDTKPKDSEDKKISSPKTDEASAKRDSKSPIERLKRIIGDNFEKNQTKAKDRQIGKNLDKMLQGLDIDEQTAALAFAYTYARKTYGKESPQADNIAKYMRKNAQIYGKILDGDSINLRRAKQLTGKLQHNSNLSGILSKMSDRPAGKIKEPTSKKIGRNVSDMFERVENQKFGLTIAGLVGVGKDALIATKRRLEVTRFGGNIQRLLAPRKFAEKQALLNESIQKTMEKAGKSVSYKRITELIQGKKEFETELESEGLLEKQEEPVLQYAVPERTLSRDEIDKLLAEQFRRERDPADDVIAAKQSTVISRTKETSVDAQSPNEVKQERPSIEKEDEGNDFLASLRKDVHVDERVAVQQTMKAQELAQSKAVLRVDEKTLKKMAFEVCMKNGLDPMQVNSATIEDLKTLVDYYSDELQNPIEMQSGDEPEKPVQEGMEI